MRGRSALASTPVVREGPWPGPPDRRIDDTNLGRYFYEVRDTKSGERLYSRGYASIYGEWETTAEAQERRRGFHESVRFPEPTGPVTVTIKKRDARGAFQPAWSVKLDPADPAIDRRPLAAVQVWAVVKNGEPADKVDLLLLGDGYTAAEMEKWHRDARRLADTLFAVSPFKEHRAAFNVWAADTPSADSGVSRPSDGVYRRTALGATYDAFGSERYVLSFDNERMRDAAAAAPYEFIEIAVNDRLQPPCGQVGAFEGAMYEARGYYRPQTDCIMFTRDEVGFCAVCRRAIDRVIALYAR